jgi:hypothetical protein
MRSFSSARCRVLVVVVCAWALTADSSVFAQASRVYEPRGPAVTAQAEEALYNMVGVYVHGIWPREEVLSTGIPSARLDPALVDGFDTTLVQILSPDLLAGDRGDTAGRFSKGDWLGLKKLHWDEDFVVGRFPVRLKGEPARVEFRGSWDYVSLTLVAPDHFPADPRRMTDAEVLKYVAEVLNIPKSSLGGMKVERRTAEIGAQKMPICYGKIRDAERVEVMDRSDQNGWWSYIPFWIAPDRCFVSVVTADVKGVRLPDEWKRLWPLREAAVEK